MPHPFAQLLAVGPKFAAFILATPLFGSYGADAISQAVVPSPNLDFSQLGRVAIGGDFSGVSLYRYEGQNEDVFRTNGSQALITTFPDGSFETLSMADAYIEAACPFVVNGALAGVVVGGNFTSLGGVEAQGIALWNPNATSVTALPGLSGEVSAVYCDAEANMVYVGGSFTGANSTNAIVWTTGWTNLPFAGFNGPVTSIVKNAAGNIVFGGEFSGLGNATTPNDPDEQVVNLGSGTITAMGSSTLSGFQDPRNIICKTSQTDGSGNTWLLADNTGGFWQGDFGFGFRPTKLRLYNTQYQGRGTKSFYFEELNSGGILNLNYIDSQGRNQSCSSQCPLPQNNATYQDFHFVPSVGMNMFRIYVTEWYGQGGGFSGIEMFQDDIYSFAVNDFNEPRCDGVSTGSSSTFTPATALWNRTPNNGQTSSDYLTAELTQQSQVSPDTNVVFTPNLKQSGNYTITVYTPGCIQDNSCNRRGMVNVTATVAPNVKPATATLYQTNNYDKFDQIYYGYIDADDASFLPSVTLTPQLGQEVPLTVVAQRVRFELIKSTGGLNGIYEYNPRIAVMDTNFSSSAINRAGSSFGAGATVNAIISQGNSLYIAGNFSGSGASNIVSITNDAQAFPDGGLNGAVNTIYQNGTLLYLGGEFTNTAQGSTDKVNYVVAYDTEANSWSNLGAGVNGIVRSIVPVPLNATGANRIDCISVNGEFTSVQAFGNNSAFAANGLAIWVPSRNNWLNNLPDVVLSVRGRLNTYTEVPGFPAIYAGRFSTEPMGLSNAVELVGSGQPSLEGLGLNIETGTSAASSNTSSTRRRSLEAARNFTGVYSGLFYDANNLNVTILGGSFTAQAENGSALHNLILVNNTTPTTTVHGLAGLNTDSAFLALDTHDTSLFAGGVVTGEVNGNAVNGLIVYDLATAAYSPNQPPALAGPNVTVNAITSQPASANVFVGGDFTSAGSLPCSGLCFYDTTAQQWETPGSGLSGVVSGMTWSSNTQLVLAGNLSIDGNRTTMATYDAKKQTYEVFSGAATLPGPVSAFSVASSDYKQFWVAGTATNIGSTFLAKYNDNVWTGVGGFGATTVINGLQVLSLTSNHDDSPLVPGNEVLMLTGNIAIPGYGNVSACLFNGTTYQPFLLTNRADGSQGTISTLFVSNPQNFMNSGGGHLALGLIVLIGLAIALGIIFLMVVAGILMERQRRRREGYVPMSMDRTGNNLERIPPESLLGGVASKGSPPRI